jgi:hypothetical protein
MPSFAKTAVHKDTELDAENNHLPAPLDVMIEGSYPAQTTWTQRSGFCESVTKFTPLDAAFSPCPGGYGKSILSSGIVRMCTKEDYVPLVFRHDVNNAVD